MNKTIETIIKGLRCETCTKERVIAEGLQD